MCMTRLYRPATTCICTFCTGWGVSKSRITPHAILRVCRRPPSEREHSFWCVVPILYAQKEGACKLHVPREAECGPFPCCAPEPSGEGAWVSGDVRRAIRRFLQLQVPSIIRTMRCSGAPRLRPPRAHGDWCARTSQNENQRHSVPPSAPPDTHDREASSCARDGSSAACNLTPTSL